MQHIPTEIRFGNSMREQNNIVKYSFGIVMLRQSLLLTLIRNKPF